MTKIV